jgi:hypothetical protein
VFAASLALFGLFAGGLAAAWQHGVARSKEQEARKRFADIRELANAFLVELDSELERLPARQQLARSWPARSESTSTNSPKTKSTTSACSANSALPMSVSAT